MADLATGKNNDLGSHCNLHLQWRSQYKVSTPSDDTQLAEQSQNSTLYLFDYRAYGCVVVIDPSVSHVQLCTPWTKACQASLSFTVSQSLLKLMSTEPMTPSNLCHPLLLLPSIFPSIRVFSIESAPPNRWPKYWSFSKSHSNEHSGMIFFRTKPILLSFLKKSLLNLLQCCFCFMFYLFWPLRHLGS